MENLNKLLFLVIALAVNASTHCMYTWQAPQFGGMNIQFPVQKEKWWMTGFIEEEPSTKPSDVVINYTEPQNKSVCIKDVYHISRTSVARFGTLPEGVEKQLYADGVSLFCLGRINNIDSSGSAAYAANRRSMGSRMIVLALALEAKPLSVLKDSQLALGQAWAYKDKKLVQLLLDEGISIP